MKEHLTATELCADDESVPIYDQLLTEWEARDE